MSAERYHSLPQLSRGQIVDFLESPTLFHKRHILKDPVWQQKPSKAMDFGTACHRAILEDRDATKGWKLYPTEVLNVKGGKGTNACRVFEELNRGVHLFKPGEELEWLAMWESLQGNTDARRLLLDEHIESQEEVSILWEHNGLSLRARLDRWLPGVIADLKTCQSGEINSIRAEIEKRKLYIQAAWYAWGLKEATGSVCDFCFVFIEKKQPYRTTCVDLDKKWITAGEDEMFDALNRLQKRADRNNWLDPCNDQIFTLDRPGWVERSLFIREDD